MVPHNAMNGLVLNVLFFHFCVFLYCTALMTLLIFVEHCSALCDDKQNWIELKRKLGLLVFVHFIFHFIVLEGSGLQNHVDLCSIGVNLILLQGPGH